MMFSNKLVACLKSNGKVLREFKDIIYIPYGSEYSILVKNLNSVRAVVNVTIDGTDVIPGGLVVNAGIEVDIERFIKDGNLKSGNKFKFIERTGNIEKHRGIKTEDGLIKVSFQFEKVYAPLYSNGHWEWKPNQPTWTGPYWIGPYWSGTSQNINAVGQSVGQISTTTTATSGITLTASVGSGSLCGTTQTSALHSNTNNAISDVGITVPGSESNQKFSTVNNFPVENETHVMVIQILGETESGKTVTAPITVKTKTRCITCNRNNKVTAKFCAECGTSLAIL